MSPEELEFWREVDSLIAPVTETQIEYRVYCDNTGLISSTSMIAEPSDQQYLVVSKFEYDNYFLYQVVNRQLKKIDSDAGYRVKLRKATEGYPVAKNHAGILIEPGETYQEQEYYAHTNS